MCLGFRASGSEFRVSGFGFRVSGFGFRVSGFGFRVSGFGFRALGFGFRKFGFRVSDIEFKHPRMRLDCPESLVNGGQGEGAVFQFFDDQIGVIDRAWYHGGGLIPCGTPVHLATVG